MTEDPAQGAPTPVFQVGGQLVRDLARDCVRLEVSEGVEGLKTMRAYFLAVGGDATGPPERLLHFDGRIMDLGKSIKVGIGPDENQRFIFEGTVSAMEAVMDGAESAVAVIHAEDQLMRLRMTRRNRTYPKTTDAGIAKEIAKAHKLDADVDADGPEYDRVQQLNQSDLAFLRERARLIQAEIWCTGKTLHFRTRHKRKAPALKLTYRQELMSVRLCADLAHQRSEVVVSGFGARGTEIIDERVGPEAIEAEIAGGRAGPRLVKTALGGSTTLRVREVALTTTEARDWATAEMLRRSRQFVTVSGKTRGSPDMVVGSRLELADVGPSFDGGGYYVTRVTHTFDTQDSFRTRFEAERPTVNEVS